MCFAAWSRWRYMRREQEKVKVLRRIRIRLEKYLVGEAFRALIFRDTNSFVDIRVGRYSLPLLRLLQQCQLGLRIYRDTWVIRNPEK